MKMEESKNNTSVLQDLKGIIGDDYDWSVKIDKNKLYLSISGEDLVCDLIFYFYCTDQCGYFNGTEERLCFHDIQIVHNILLYMENNTEKICKLINLFSKKESVV